MNEKTSQNYEVVVYGWESGIRLTDRKPGGDEVGFPVFETLSDAKQDLLEFLRGERDQYNITIHNTRTLRIKDFN